MADYIETLRKTLQELVEQRQHIDADIRDLAKIIRRHEGASGGTPVLAPREEGRAAPPGEGRRETLALMEAGGIWTTGRLAEARKAGRLRSEGKTYRVNDGDVLEILFSR